MAGAFRMLRHSINLWRHRLGGSCFSPTSSIALVTVALNLHRCFVISLLDSPPLCLKIWKPGPHWNGNLPWQHPSVTRARSVVHGRGEPGSHRHCSSSGIEGATGAPVNPTPTPRYAMHPLTATWLLLFPFPSADFKRWPGALAFVCTAGLPLLITVSSSCTIGPQKLYLAAVPGGCITLAQQCLYGISRD